jgi:hypothetical protein
MARKREPWIKAVGRGKEPLPDDWVTVRPDLLKQVRFNEQPSGIRQGDLLVYYAAGRKKLFAIVRASQHGDNCQMERDSAFPTYDWRMPIQVCLMVADLRLGADYELLGEGPGWIQRKSHVRLKDAQYEAVVAFFVDRLKLA